MRRTHRPDSLSGSKPEAFRVFGYLTSPEHPYAQSITAAADALSLHLSARRSPDGPRLRVV
jgi:hypothetical protein